MTDSTDSTDNQPAGGNGSDVTTIISATDAPPADDSSTANSEAASFRHRLRAVETERDGMISERDALAGQLATMRRSEVERLASTGLSKPADVWIDGAEVDALLDSDGRVDAALVAEVVASVLAERPGLATFVRRAPMPDPSQGRDQSEANGAGWADVIKSARR